jgi:Domain of unknown function (DUF4252)
MKRIPFFAFLMTLAPAVPADAQIQFKLDNLASKAKESVDISLPLPMLQLASGFLSKDKSMNPEIQKLVAGLKNITVKTYTFAEEGQYKAEDLQPVRDQLRGAGWGVLLGKHDKEGSTDVYAKSEGGQIAGIAVVKTEPKEVRVVYIEGAIDLAGLAGLAGQFGIPALGLPGQNSDPTKTKGVQ